MLQAGYRKNKHIIAERKASNSSQPARTSIQPYLVALFLLQAIRAVFCGEEIHPIELLNVEHYV